MIGITEETFPEMTPVTVKGELGVVLYVDDTPCQVRVAFKDERRNCSVTECEVAELTEWPEWMQEIKRKLERANEDLRRLLGSQTQ